MVEPAKNTSTAAGAAPNTKAANPETEARSTGEPIDSIAVRDFYTEEMVYVTEGQRYAYVPVEDKPYPYENMHPIDPAFDKKYREEFADFKKEKRDKIAARGSIKETFRRLGDLDE